MSIDSEQSTIPRNYVFGDEVLDQLLAGGIEPGSLILVLGHPGAGKSTFATRIVFENVMRYNIKGVYLSFAETKAKFYSYMRRFNIDLELAEKKQLFEFVQMLTMSGKDLLDFTVSTLGQKVLGEGYSIAVVDSITPILNVLTTDEARAFLHSTLYNLVSNTNALLILIADLPFAVETVDLRGLEFIADAVFVFKTRIEKGLIHRFMEIRKFRGKPIPMAEIPFSIEDGRGVRMLLSPTVIQPPYTASVTSYSDECSNLVWRGLASGSYVGVVATCNVIPLTFWALLARIVFSYGANYGIISFRDSPENIKNILRNAAGLMKIPPHYILNKAAFIESIHPAAYSTQQLETIIRNYIDSNIQILVLDGIESLYLYYDPILVDRMLKSISMYVKSSPSVMFELVDNIYTQSQTMRYDIIHEILCDQEKLLHSATTTRTSTSYLRTPSYIVKVYDDDLAKCIETHPFTVPSTSQSG
ncbi:MAG: ATPase domain-containing protein [Ignisphaera sp.]